MRFYYRYSRKGLVRRVRLTVWEAFNAALSGYPVTVELGG